MMHPTAPQLACAAKRCTRAKGNEPMPNHWILVGSPGNFEKSRALGWTVQGIKSRHRKKAEQMHAGDTFIYYLTGVQAFGGIVTATSDYWEAPHADLAEQGPEEGDRRLSLSHLDCAHAHPR